MSTQIQNAILNELPDQDRLTIYNFIISACTHLYSKNKFQIDKFNSIASSFSKLTKEDPIFMVHLTAWAAKQQSKDLKVLTIFFNSLNDADGSSFFPGSSKNKPNFRTVSATLLQQLDPRLALRVIELANYKFNVPNFFGDGRHFASFLSTAFRKYILYRELNIDMIKGIKNNGMAKAFIKLYKMMHMAPSANSAGILGWNQRDKTIIKNVISFEGKTKTEIAKEIIDRKLSPLVAISALTNLQMGVSVAKALLQNCTGNQAIILQNLFRTRGFLEVESIKNLFDKKIKTATTVVDRIDTLSKDLTDEEKKAMASVRSQKRKEATVGIGKVFIHIDISPSMDSVIKFAKEKSSIFSECVNNPKENFGWGIFHDYGKLLKIPDNFTKEDFHASLYGIKTGGMGTNCLALYEKARLFGANIDVYFTDQGHNHGSIVQLLEKSIKQYGKPAAVVIVNFGLYNGENLKGPLHRSFEAEGIPVAFMKPESLSQSALVAQSINAAIKGQMAIIDEIMETTLPKLPKWYFDINKIKIKGVSVEK
jgi:hypothetical protein